MKQITLNVSDDMVNDLTSEIDRVSAEAKFDLVNMLCEVMALDNNELVVEVSKDGNKIYGKEDGKSRD